MLIYFVSALFVLWSTTVGLSQQNELRGKLDVAINGNRVSVPHEYVTSWTNRAQSHPNELERLWVTFSASNFEPLGSDWFKDRTTEAVQARRQELWARGDEVVDLILAPVRGQIANAKIFERACMFFEGTLEHSERKDVAQTLCFMRGKIQTGLFRRAGKSDVLLTCQPDGQICDAQFYVFNRTVLAELVWIRSTSIPKVPELAIVAERFIAEQMKAQ